MRCSGPKDFRRIVARAAASGLRYGPGRAQSGSGPSRNGSPSA